MSGVSVAINTLAALTGFASRGLTIALDALSAIYLERAAAIGMDPAVLHRVAVIGSYKDILMVGILGAIIALVVVIGLGSFVGSY
jgi:hypothetical protein